MIEGNFRRNHANPERFAEQKWQTSKRAEPLAALGDPVDVPDLSEDGATIRKKSN